MYSVAVNNSGGLHFLNQFQVVGDSGSVELEPQIVIDISGVTSEQVAFLHLLTLNITKDL